MQRTDLRRQDVHNLLASVIDDAIRYQRDGGGVIEPLWGLAAPMRAAQLIAAVSLLPRNEDAAEQNRLRSAAEDAASWLRTALGPGARFDLPSTNPDSAPDTAFVVQLLGIAVETMQRHQRLDLAALQSSVIDLITTCVPGMATGGFHTPNHRWVICSALAQGLKLTGDEPIAQKAISDYLAETFDIDAEGAWIERSAGGYDAVNNRALLLLAATGRVPESEAMVPVLRNLALDIALLNSDATIEVALSSRQDHGTVTVPHELAAIMLWAGQVAGDDYLAGVGAWIFGRGTPAAGPIVWMSYVLDRFNLTTISPVPPRDGVRVLPGMGLWRERRGEQTVSMFSGARDFLTVHAGAASIRAVGLHHTHFGPATGWFWPETAEFRQDGVQLRSEGTRDARRPGYDLPTTSPVAPHEWDEIRQHRGLRRLPSLSTTVSLQRDQAGVAIEVHTDTGLDGVPAVLYLDFPAGGVWRTGDSAFRPVAGQTILLRHGQGEMLFGAIGFRVGPGGDAHEMWEPHNLPARRDIVRVLIPLMTPIDKHVRIEVVGP